VGDSYINNRPERAVQNGSAILSIALSGRNLLTLTHRVAVGCYALPFQGGRKLEILWIQSRNIGVVFGSGIFCKFNLLTART
jgi:hypothetical protein